MPKGFKTVIIPERVYLLAKECVEEGIARSISEVISEAVESYAEAKLEALPYVIAKEFTEVMKSFGHPPPPCPRCGRPLNLTKVKDSTLHWRCPNCGFQTRT